MTQRSQSGRKTSSENQSYPPKQQYPSTSTRSTPDYHPQVQHQQQHAQRPQPPSLPIGAHAKHTFRSIESSGPPSRPLEFPTPKVHRAVRVNALVVHPQTGMRDILEGVIHREEYHLPTVASSSRAVAGNENVRGSGNDIGNSQTDGKQGARKIPGSRKDGSKARVSSSPSASQSPAGSSSNTTNTTSSTPPGKDWVAYFPQRRLQDAIYGCVYACLLLKRHFGEATEDAARAAGLEPGDPSAPIVWEIVGTHVAMKMVSWSKVHQHRGRLLEDPVKEIKALQYVAGYTGGFGDVDGYGYVPCTDGSRRDAGQNCPHVIGSIEILQNDDYLFSVMPYAKGGDLFGHVVRETEWNQEHRGEEGGMSEPVARYWFRQILEGLHFLQMKGICHRDLSLENILVDENNSLIIDLGMCLRVPYSSRENPSQVTDVSRGSSRRLIQRSGTCGKHNYMSPEIYQNTHAFDGFAVDLWAAGVILYIMLTGFPPYDHATMADTRFEIIVNGALMDQLKTWEIYLSNEAGDLLQRMLQLDPRDRLTLAEVMQHPWLMNPDVRPPRQHEEPFRS